MVLLVVDELSNWFSVGLVGVEHSVLIVDMLFVEIEILSLSSIVELLHDLWKLLVVALWLLQEVNVSVLDLVRAEACFWLLVGKSLNSEVNGLVNWLGWLDASCEKLVLVFCLDWGRFVDRTGLGRRNLACSEFRCDLLLFRRAFISWRSNSWMTVDSLVSLNIFEAFGWSSSSNVHILCIFLYRLTNDISIVRLNLLKPTLS